MPRAKRRRTTKGRGKLKKVAKLTALALAGTAIGSALGNHLSNPSRGQGRVTNLAKKAAAAALAAAVTGYAANRIPRMTKRKSMDEIYNDNMHRHMKNTHYKRIPTQRFPRARPPMSATGRRRGKLKRLAKAALTTAAAAAAVPLADRYFTPAKGNWHNAPPHVFVDRNPAASGGGISSLLIPAAAMYGAYKYHAPSRRAMQAGNDVLRTVGPSMARAWQGGRGIGSTLKKAAKWAVPAALATAAAYHYRQPLGVATKWGLDAARNKDYSSIPREMYEGFQMGRARDMQGLPKPSWKQVFSAQGIGSTIKKVARLGFKSHLPRVSGRGYKAGVSRMKRLQTNPRKPRKGTPRRPRTMATIRGRGGWDDFVSGFSMPFQAIGGLANAAAPALPFLKFL